MRRTTRGKLATGVFLFIRLALGLVFCYSAVEKLSHPMDFLGSVYDFEIADPALGLVVAIVLPWLELVLSLALVSGLGEGGALLGSVLLFGLFLGVQLSAVWRGLSVSCGCFGPEKESMVGLRTLARTALLLLVALLASGWHWFRQSRRSGPAVKPPAGDPVLSRMEIAARSMPRWPGRIVTFLRLSGRVRRLFLGALVRLAVTRVALLVVPYRFLRASMVRLIRDDGGRPIGNDPAAREILWAVEQASRCLLIRHCLTRALVAKRLFLRHGFRVDFRIGVNRTARGKLGAHAWLESNGRIVIGRLSALGDYANLPLTGSPRR